MPPLTTPMRQALAQLQQAGGAGPLPSSTARGLVRRGLVVVCGVRRAPAGAFAPSELRVTLTARGRAAAGP